MVVLVLDVARIGIGKGIVERAIVHGEAESRLRPPGGAEAPGPQEARRGEAGVAVEIAGQLAVKLGMAEPGEVVRTGTDDFEFEVGTVLVALQFAASQVEVVSGEADAPAGAVPRRWFLSERCGRNKAQQRHESGDDHW